jgi:hypothetical protein
MSRVVIVENGTQSWVVGKNPNTAVVAGKKSSVVIGCKQGLPGKDGDSGTAATIEVGTVTTVAAGENATVTNSGTENAAVFDFKIPQGAQGIQGTVDYSNVKVKQIVTLKDNLVAVQSNKIIPPDNTIPQSDEGFLWQTITITPTVVGSKLLIVGNIAGSLSKVTALIVALFKNTETDASYTRGMHSPVTNTQINLAFQAELVTTSLSPLTISLNIGATIDNIITINGVNGSQRYGGTLESVVTIMEVIQ